MPVLDHINNNNGQSNRVFDALRLYAEQEAQFKIFHPVGGHDLHATALKLVHYTHIKNTYRKRPNNDEKQSLRFVRSEIANLKARLNPTLLNRILYSNIGNIVRNYIKRRHKLVTAHRKPLNTIQKTLIQENNLQSLNESLKKAGFNYQMDGTLKKMMDQGFPQFHLPYADTQNKNSYFVLHFNKLPGTDQYYFEKFEAVARPTLDSLLNRDTTCQRHTFSQIGNEERFTASEADRLVNGKHIYKNRQGKDSWLSLNPISKQLNSISFNIEKALAKLPITIKKDTAQYDSLLQSLKNGKSKEVSLLINGQSIKYTLEAAPDRKAIDVLDRNGVLVDSNKLFSGQSHQVAQQIIEKQMQSEQIIDMGQGQGVKHR
jgi:hypothetical protein